MDSSDMIQYTINRNPLTKKNARQIQKIKRKLEYRNEIIHSIRHSPQSRNSRHSNILDVILKSRESGPEYVCFCCCGLFFEHSVLEKCTDHTKYYIEAFQYVHRHDSQYVCRYCWDFIKKGIIPKRVYDQNLQYAILPDCFNGMTNLEARMCSPIINFMKIIDLKPKSSFSQKGIAGSVVHIPVDIESMLSILPRQFDDLNVIHVTLKRKQEHKSSYLEETISPSRIMSALKYLVETPLYKQNSIIINENFFRQYHHDQNNEMFVEDKVFVSGTLINDKVLDAVDESSDLELEITDKEDDVMIHDLHMPLMNKKCTVFAPGENKIPISAKLIPHTEELCFPQIFGGHPYDKDQRLTYAERCKTQLRHYLRRCCNSEIILYMERRKLEEHVTRNINICVRQHAMLNQTKHDIDNNKHIENLIFSDHAFKFLQHARCSPPYWAEKRRDVIAMIGQLGRPTIFYTQSANEYQSPELLSILFNIHFHTDKMTPEMAIFLENKIKNMLVKNNAVTVVQYYKHLWKNIRAYLESPIGVFENNYVVDYYVRDEFQQRGSIHMHSFLYLKDAPMYDKETPSSVQEVIQFIDKFITCNYDAENPLLEVQKHKHTHTCYKNTINKVCRFHYPLPVMPATNILEPLSGSIDVGIRRKAKNDFKEITALMNEYYNAFTDVPFEHTLKTLNFTLPQYHMAIRSSLKQAKVFLKRKSTEVGINAYNLDLLKLTEANMDIQYVLDEYACATYLTNYVGKFNNGLSKMLLDLKEELRSEDRLDFRQKLFKMANTFINGNIMSVQEAVHDILQMSVSEMSRKVINISSFPKSERCRILKSNYDLCQLSDDSTDIYKENIFDYYSARCPELNDICLAEFATCYQQYTISKKNSTPKRRKIERILRFCNFKKEKDAHRYYKEQLLLFLPWRDEIVEIEEIDFLWKYYNHVEEISRNRLRFAKIDTTDLENKINCNNDDEVDSEDEMLSKELHKDIGIELQDQKSDKYSQKSLTTVKYLMPEVKHQKELNIVMEKLNEKQREFVLHVLNRVKTNDYPFHYFLSGAAGVGKSVTINAIYHSVTNFFLYNAHGIKHEDKPKVLLTAPTGLAAFLIQGMTLHTAFALPITRQRADLSCSKANTIRERLSDLKLIIIDEISMVGNNKICLIDQRLQQITGCSQPFGGISIIAVGDLYQLAPVNESYVFKPPSNELGFLVQPLWHHFRMYQLTEVMRQKDDKAFVTALNNFSKGSLTEIDIKLLKSRQVRNDNEVPQDAIRLFSTNANVMNYNKIKINQMPGNLYLLKPEIKKGTNTNKTLRANDVVQNKELVDREIQLKIGIKYMLVRNLDTNDGLVNGAIGILKHITFKRNSDSEVDIIWMEFANKNVGRKSRTNFQHIINDESIPINFTPVTRMELYFERPGKAGYMLCRQFPIMPAEALTIHKCQGCTFASICIDFTHMQRKTTSLIYVALSRVPSINGLYIIGDFVEPTFSSNSVKMEMNRLQAAELNLSKEDMFVKSLNIAYLNIRHLKPNLTNIGSDKWYANMDILILSETYTELNDHINIDGFTKLVRFDKTVHSYGNEYKTSGFIVMIRNDMKNCLSFKIIHSYIYGNHYSHTIITTFSINDYIIISGYKSPRVSQNDFKKILLGLHRDIFNANSTRKLVFIGDFNYNCFNSGNDLEKELNLYGFEKQLADGVATTNRNTQIDVIFTKNIKKSVADTHETYFSDHKAVYISIEDDFCINLKNYESPVPKKSLSATEPDKITQHNIIYKNLCDDFEVLGSKSTPKNSKDELVIGYLRIGDLKMHREQLDGNELYEDIDILILVDTKTNSEDTVEDICFSPFDILFMKESPQRSNDIIGLVNNNTKAHISYREICYFAPPSSTYENLNTQIMIFNINGYVIVSGYKSTNISLVEFMSMLEETMNIVKINSSGDKVVLLIGCFSIHEYSPVNMLNINLEYHNFYNIDEYLHSKNKNGEIVAMFTKNTKSRVGIGSSSYLDNKIAYIQVPFLSFIDGDKQPCNNENSNGKEISTLSSPITISPPSHLLKTQIPKGISHKTVRKDCLAIDNLSASHSLDASTSRKHNITAVDETITVPPPKKQRTFHERFIDYTATAAQIDIILNDCLTDDVIRIFIHIANTSFQEYFLQDTLFYQMPHNYNPVASHKDDVQILYSPGHWICCHYTPNNKTITIYDSLKEHKRLLPKHTQILERLYPQNQRIEFAKLSCHQTGVMCGVFACAYVTDIMNGNDPQNILYDIQRMRRHLKNIIESKVIRPFPAFNRYSLMMQTL